MIHLKEYVKYTKQSNHISMLEANDHKASNRLLEEFVPNYTNFEETSLDSFKGYKVVEKINLNYYSVVSGLFRYQRGTIDHKSYSSLYKKNMEYFNEHLLDRICVFVNKEDAIEALIETKHIIKKWSGGSNDLALMEVTISDNLESALFSNKSVDDREVYIGGCIDSVREIEVLD